MEEVTDNLAKEVEKIYTPLSVAKEEIWRRWNDKELRKKVEDFLGKDLPISLGKEPFSAIFRYVATPNLEFELAFDSSKLLGLDLMFIEFLEDKFCTTNRDKVHLGKMYFYKKKNGEKGSIKSCDKILNLTNFEGKEFRKLKTTWGENFIDFHHRIFFSLYGNTKTFNASELKKNGENAYEVYLKIFSFFICNGVLFENYFINTSKYERKFTEEIILPAFKQISELFGVKPLIIPLASQKEDGDVFWQYYNTNISDKIKINKQKYDLQLNYKH